MTQQHEYDWTRLSFHVAHQWVKRQTVFELEELASTAWLAGHRAIDSYDPDKGALTTYLMPAMHHGIIAALTQWHQTRRTGGVVVTPEPLPPTLASSAEAIDVAVTRKIDLERAVASLPPRLRRIAQGILHEEYGGYGQRALFRETVTPHLTQATLHQYAHEARGLLRTRLK